MAEKIAPQRPNSQSSKTASVVMPASAPSRPKPNVSIVSNQEEKKPIRSENNMIAVTTITKENNDSNNDFFERKNAKLRDKGLEKIQGDLFFKVDSLNDTIKTKIIQENLDIYYKVNKKEKTLKSWINILITLVLIVSIGLVLITLFYPVGTQILPKF